MKKPNSKQKQAAPLTMEGVTKMVKKVVFDSQEELAMMVKRGFDAVDQRFEEVDKKFVSLEKKFDDKIDNMESRFNQKIDGLTNRIDDLSLNRATREQFLLLDHLVGRIEQHLKIEPKIRTVK